MHKTLKRITAGRLVYAVLYTAPGADDSQQARAQKRKASTEARERLNARTSFQKLERTLAANFDNGDLFVTITYDDKHLPDSKDKAVRRVRSYLSKLRAARKRNNQPLRYIYVTEGGCPGGRLHHHIVMNATGEDTEDLRRLWIYGSNVEIEYLKFTPMNNYEGLASYLTKEPREWGHPHVGERTWTPSLGLIRPEPETEFVAYCMALSAPPEADILFKEGPIRNGYGEFAYIKYLLPYDPDRRKPKPKRRKKKQE